MAVVIAYQSLNSNTSSDHGVSASNSQMFTRMTHDHSAMSLEPWLLTLPTARRHLPDVAVEGPAQLLAAAPSGFMNQGQRPDSHFLSMVEGKARQIHQHVIRAFSKSCDLLVFGELDSSHPEWWSSMERHAGNVLFYSNPKKACNCFSVHCPGHMSHPIAEGDGWIVIACENVIAAFVHVPNAIAPHKDKLIVFYQQIDNVVRANGFSIDLFMGDTNQSAPGVTPEVVSRALNTPFLDAHQGKVIAPVDAFQKVFAGTNATATKKYDIVVYNPKTINKIEVAYLSQHTAAGMSAAAMTDHMGVCVHIEK